jgi:polyhydroxyalkanoate synthesis regulator phasin
MAPTQVWEGYMQVSKGRDYWDDLLKRWHVQAVVVDKLEQERLTRLVRGHGGWEVVYEDEMGIVVIPKDEGVE